MLADLVKERLWRVYVGEIARCRTRVDHVRQRYPSAQSQELAQHLTDTKKGWASTGGGISGLFCLLLGPADLPFRPLLPLTPIIEVALVHKVHLQSNPARDQVS